MKKRRIVFVGLFLASGLGANGQLLDRLKERAKEKGIETSDEVTYDISAYDPDMEVGDGDDYEALELKSAAEFYNKDVVMTLYDHEGRLTQTSYFDAETIAMRTELANGMKPVYHDEAGNVYAYNNEKAHYENMKLLPSSSMGFMVAGMTTQLYQLPHVPYFDAMKALDKIDSGLNFLVLEMAFIYKREHFGGESYVPLEMECGESKKCIRFNYNIPDYPGSYIQFDEQGRLDEFYINSTQNAFKDNPAGRFLFDYRECSVELPDSVEQSMIPGPLNKILNLERGLEPWKHNKKDK